jgi:hypothetical protein
MRAPAMLPAAATARRGLVALVVLAAAACGGQVTPGGSAPGSTVAADGGTTAPDATEPAQSAQAEVAGLDGTLTFTSDAKNGAAGSTTEAHGKLSVTVHLVAQDGGPGFVDAGSTYSYSETNRVDDAQTVSSCGLHVESSGSGSGPFVSPDGLIVGWYGSNNPEVTIGIHAPYTDASSSTFLCNGQTSNVTTPGVATVSCGDPAGGSLVGRIEPGDVMAVAPGQAIDFTCTEAFAIGQGGVTVSGTLTSH